MSLPYSAGGGAVRLAVRVTPRARKDEATGVIATGDGRNALAVRLSAPPAEGAANRALVAFLAGALRVPKSAISILSGDTSRLKMVRIEGADVERLARLCDQ